MIEDDLVGGQVWLRWVATEDRPPSVTEEYLLVHDKSIGQLDYGVWCGLRGTFTLHVLRLYYLFRPLPDLG